MKSILIRLGLLALIISVLAGCSGSSGSAGANGTPGANATGTMLNVSNLSAADWLALKPSIDPASISVNMSSGKPVIKFKVTDGNGNPLIGLGGQSQSSTALTPKNYNVFFTLAKLIPPAVPAGSSPQGAPGKWVSYLVTKPSGTVGNVTLVGTYPTPEQEGTLVDNGDGSYQYTFYRDVTQSATIVAGLTDDATHFKADLGDVSYQPTLTHRLGIVVQGSQPGTGTNTPTAVQTTTPVPLVNTFNIGYDFVPAGGAVTTTRDIVEKASCTTCHDGRGIGHISAASATNGVPPGSFIGRNDPRLCVTCHTDQTKYSFVNVVETSTSGTDPTLSTPYYRTTTGDAAFTFPRMIHQTHMGDALVKTGYNLNAHCNDPNGPFYNPAKATANSAQCFNRVGLPQDQRNCTVCHDGSATAVNKTANGDNWKNLPSRLACGSCHDGIDFTLAQGAVGSITLADRDIDAATPAPIGTTHSGHGGGIQNDDNSCASGGCHTPADITIAHQAPYATPHNLTPQAGVATFAYVLQSVTVNSNMNPQFKFNINMTLNSVTTPVTALPIPSVTDGANTYTFTGGPSFYVAYAVPQDGIATPADFNVSASATLANILSGAQGTLTSDGNGNFTAIVKGTAAAPVTVPAAASSMVTGAIIGHFTQNGLPNYPSPGLNIVTPLALKTATNYTARRAIVRVDKCNSCHDQLGTSPNFHGGDRNDPQACNICHNGNRTSSGWSADSSTYIHGIHGASKRSVPFTWHATAVDDNFSMLLYPGLLKDCNQCHLPDSVNFGVTGGTTVAPNLLWSTTASAVFNPTVGTVTNACTPSIYNNNCIATDASVFALSPYVIKDNTTNYGTVFSYKVNASGVPPTYTAASSTTLVNSPIASACFACHDTPLAKTHMEGNGGAIYETRASQSDGSGNLINKEQCLVCHGKGRVADVAVVHQQ